LIGQPPVLNYAANQQSISQIDRTGLYDFIKLNLSYTANYKGYTTLPTLVGNSGWESTLNLIQNVTLTATGNAAGSTTDTLVNTDFLTLAVYQYYYSGGSQPGGNTLVTPAAGAQSVQGAAKIFFIDPWSNKGTMTRLDARLLSQLNLSVSWRDPSSFSTGGAGGTTTVTSGMVVLSVREWQNVPQLVRPWLRMSDRKVQIVSQQNALQVQGVPIGNVIRRELLQGIVPQAAGYNYGWTSPAAFGSTGQAQGPMMQLLINNSIKVLNQSLNNLSEDNIQLFQLPPQPQFGSTGGNLNGWFVYEPARQKKVSQSLPMWGVNRADNYIDVAAPGGNGSYLKMTDLELVGATQATLS
jgi:hypothetical protein